MGYLHYISCLRYTILVVNPRYVAVLVSVDEHADSRAQRRKSELVCGSWGLFTAKRKSRCIKVTASEVTITTNDDHDNTVCLLVGCLTSQQQASVSQGRICTDNFMCCHTEIEVADQTFHLTQSQYTDTGPTSPSADPITPGAWQGSHWSANV